MENSKAARCAAFLYVITRGIYHLYKIVSPSLLRVLITLSSRIDAASHLWTMPSREESGERRFVRQGGARDIFYVILRLSKDLCVF